MRPQKNKKKRPKYLTTMTTIPLDRRNYEIEPNLSTWAGDTIQIQIWKISILPFPAIQDRPPLSLHSQLFFLPPSQPPPSYAFCHRQEGQ